LDRKKEGEGKTNYHFAKKFPEPGICRDQVLSVKAKEGDLGGFKTPERENFQRKESEGQVYKKKVSRNKGGDL